jgi:hypothetical protein
MSGACAQALPFVLQYRTLPPSQDGLWGCHVPSNFRTHLPDRKGSNTTTCTVDPDPLGGLQCATCLAASDPTSLRGGLQTAMRPVVLCGPRASSIKKSLAGLPMQLGSHVLNTHAYVYKASNIRAIMGLQDVWEGSAITACKTCGQAATVQRWPY